MHPKFIKPKLFEDDRGFFTEEFSTRDSDFRIKQVNRSFNHKKGTIRGLHFQYPKEQAKLIRCIKGQILDVSINLQTKEIFAYYLSKNDMLLVPRGYAHSYVALKDDTEVVYYVDRLFRPDQSKGILWSSVPCAWPEINIISEQDKNWPTMEEVCKSFS